MEGKLMAGSGAGSSPLLSPGEGSAIAAGKPPGPPESGETAAQHFADMFGADSMLARWLAEQYLEARRMDDYQTESELEHNGIPLQVRLETLRQHGTPYGIALLLADRSAALGDGDAIVTRQQWHDIKNHLGGVKLYATFLKRKLADGEDQPIVDKILNGINGLIEQMARIRRGE
jgi:nitrogen fixation/metabolism regulation signal transduction histidine kinase